MPRHFAPAAALALLVSAAPSAAQQEGGAAAQCPAAPAPLPAELASWGARTPLAAGTQADRLGPATLTIGRAVDATLVHTPDVRYPVRPEQPGGSVAYGGLFAFTVAEAGTYRVALGSGAWIDVVKDGKAIESTAHGHGPDCSGVRKVVDFPLQPGSYTLQVAANGQAQLPLLVTRAP
ncbi:MAG TPA: homogentisate 1,2-dioxygenase [Sphingomonadaceae bacterium]